MKRFYKLYYLNFHQLIYLKDVGYNEYEKIFDEYDRVCGIRVFKFGIYILIIQFKS